MLNVTSVSDAKKILKQNLSLFLSSEEIFLDDAVGRVLFEAIVSSENVPSFNRSTVDGFAVHCADTYGASESSPCYLDLAGEVMMGEGALFSIKDGECAKVATGGMLPKNADAVVMLEQVQEENPLCLIFKSVSPFENVTKTGDDVKENRTVLEKGRLLTPTDIGVLAALGIEKIRVQKKPRVAIISTGDELVEISKSPMPGQVRDINSHLLSALIRSCGGEAINYGIAKDDRSSILEKVKDAAEECDIVLISGGSSAGARDMTGDIISSLGEVFVHGIAMKPGKPTIIGKIKDKAVFGLPGHPAASFFVFCEFVKPLISDQKERTLEAVLSSNISSNNGREEFVCVKLSEGNAEPVFAKSGIFSLLSSCDGYIGIDRNCEGLDKGSRVTVHLF